MVKSQKFQDKLYLSVRIKFQDINSKFLQLMKLLLFTNKGKTSKKIKVHSGSRFHYAKLKLHGHVETSLE